ncbi:MAG: hypothetical protein QOH70_1324 [Blastocatellia bacterium]|nr:hypothetical protein [Blastocatellia bacterium]
MLVGVPLASFGEFGIGFGSEPNDHVWLARRREFSFDLVPRSALSGIAFNRLQPSIEFSLLTIGQFEGLILFGDCVPNFFNQEDSVGDAELLCLLG